MRPAGEIRKALLHGLDEGPGRTRTLAQRIGLDVELTRRTLGNLCRDGQVVKVDEERVPGVRRRVPVYDLASRQPARSEGWPLLMRWSLQQLG